MCIRDSPDTYSTANRVLIDAQAGIELAQAWGGGLVAAVDGMRFVVPVRAPASTGTSPSCRRTDTSTGRQIANGTFRSDAPQGPTRTAPPPPPPAGRRPLRAWG